MPTLLHRCMTKATTAEDEQIQYGPHWALARRALLKVYDDHLECGNWSIPNADIREAVLYTIRSTFFIPGFILRIRTPGKLYHFGLNYGRFWTRDLPFPVRREQAKLGYTPLSIIARVLAVGFLLYWLWTRFFAQA